MQVVFGPGNLPDPWRIVEEVTGFDKWGMRLLVGKGERHG